MPVAVEPVSAAQIATWVASTVPSESRLHRFKWLFQDERGSLGGKGAARIAPPDTLRFDAEAIYASDVRSAVVIGETPRWIEPPDALERIVPDYTLFWAMFGIARLPAAGVELRGLATDGGTAWRYAGPTDTIDYWRSHGSPSKFLAEVRHAGTVVGRTEVTLSADGAPLAATLIVPSVPAKLDLKFLSTTRTTFAAETWLRHR